MIFLMLLQEFLAILYFYTAPFKLDTALMLILFVNMGVLFKLGQIYWRGPDDFFKKIKFLRIIFTGTLIVLELLIYLLPQPIGTSPLQGFVNDVEVFVTGILVGVLWQDRILAITSFMKRSD